MTDNDWPKELPDPEAYKLLKRGEQPELPAADDHEKGKGSGEHSECQPLPAKAGSLSPALSHRSPDGDGNGATSET